MVYVLSHNMLPHMLNKILFSKFILYSQANHSEAPVFILGLQGLEVSVL